MQSPRCLLCDAPVDDDVALQDHLAAVHDLEDDPGTESRLDDLGAVYLGGEPQGATALFDAGPVVAPSHVHDPAADDDRWRPVTIGIGGLLLIALAAIALLVV